MRKKEVLMKTILVGSIVTLFVCSVMVCNSIQNTIQTSSNVSNDQGLSNKKIEWGIKRAKDHKQPDVGGTNQKLMQQYNGMYMGNKESKNLYLTFDEGYEAGYTEKILEILKQNNVKATFFITAHYFNSQPELVSKMVQEGHIIGNHTVNHKSMPELKDDTVKKEVMDLHTAIYQKTGVEMKYIRPPKGEFSERTLALTNSLGYTTVMWSVAYDDWDENHQKGEEYAKSKILDNLHPGAVILLHGNSKDNTNVLDTVIKQARQMGYEFKSLEEYEK